MPKKPLTNIEIQKRLDALERRGMAEGGNITLNSTDPFSPNFNINSFSTIPGGAGNDTIPAEFIGADGTVSAAADTGVGGLGTIDFLTRAQNAGLTTKNSTFETDANDLTALKASSGVTENDLFSKPPMYADPTTGKLLTTAEYESQYCSLGNTGIPKNPYVTVNADGSKVNTDPATGQTTYFAADGTITGV